MNASQAIVFELGGKEYIYRGKLPPELVDAFFDAGSRMENEGKIEEPKFTPEGHIDFLSGFRSMVTFMGGQILRVQGASEDGTMRWVEFPEAIIH